MSEEDERDDGKEPDQALAPARTITFDTDEGSWLSLDVSPDGATILFELLGDLYTLPMAGGEANRLTGGLGFHSQPRYSPDGTSIVFVSDRNGGDNLWLMDADGGNARLLLGDAAEQTDSYTSPTWTPDGEYIVATKGEVWETHKLWIYHRDGGSGAELVTGAWSLNIQGPAFGPDPRFVYFSRKSGAFAYNMTRFEWQLAVFDRQLGRTAELTSEHGGALRPILSPDGRWLVYATRHDAETALRIRDLASGDERWLAYPVQRDDQESRFQRDLMPGSAFTPDSRFLVTSYGGKIWKIAIPKDGWPGDRWRGEEKPPADVRKAGKTRGRERRARARTDGSPAGTDLAEQVHFTVHVESEMGPPVFFEGPLPDGPVQARQIRRPTLSPDGARLAFTALDRLWIQDFPGGVPERISDRPEGEFAPSWSPDGGRLAHASWGREGGRLWVSSVAGGEPPLCLTEDLAHYDAPVWSPDGECIVFVKGPRHPRIMESGPKGRELHWMPAEGGESHRIMPLFGAGRPHFADDPERIFVYEGGGSGLVSVRLDGSDRRTHVRVVGYKEPSGDRSLPASEIMMAPDGRSVLAQVHNQIYRIAGPFLGDFGPRISVEDPHKAPYPVTRLTTLGGEFPGWHDGGKAVSWSLGRTFFLTSVEGKGASKEGGGGKGAVDHHPVRVVMPRDRAQGTLVLSGARIVTMKGDEVIPEGEIVVEGHRIRAIGAKGTCDVPEGARVLELGGTTIIPGLIDMHAHLRPPLGLHKTQVWAYLANLAYGVTATRDPQTETTDVLSYADLVEIGEILGPRIFATGPGIFPEEDIRSLDDARNILRRYNRHFGVRTVKQYLSGNREQRQWIIMAAREEKLMPTTEGALDMKLDLTQIIDGYPAQEHSFPIIPLYRDVIELVARSGMYYTPALLVAYGGPWAENYFFVREDLHTDRKLRRFTPHHELDRRILRRPAWFREGQHVFPRMAEVARDIVRAGGKVCLGSHGQLQGLGAHWELEALQSGGMTEHEALRCATLFGAEALGCQEDLGSLEPGRLADLLVLDENPLEDIRNSRALRHVMKNGRLYEADTLNEVWPRERALESLWWWEREPKGLPGLR